MIEFRRVVEDVEQQGTELTLRITVKEDPNPYSIGDLDTSSYTDDANIDGFIDDMFERFPKLWTDLADL